MDLQSLVTSIVKGDVAGKIGTSTGTDQSQLKKLSA